MSLHQPILSKTKQWILFQGQILQRGMGKNHRWRIHTVASKKKLDKEPLRLGLFSLDQLERHAKELAAKHEIIDGPGKDQLLLRLAENEHIMLQAYNVLNTAAQTKQQISPAGEWLLDNYHLIEEQIRIARRHLPKGYSRELPHLANTPSADFPRVYDIALEVIAHVDGRVDKENITCFVNAYQQVTQLKLGEFWAIPIMLRLALIENLTRVAMHVITAMKDREKANQWADQLLHFAEFDASNLILVAADMARSHPPMSNAFVAELIRRLRGQGPALDIPLTWIEQNLVDRGQSTQQLVQLEGQQQAANQVAVGASISSLRFLSAMDWRDFVESASLVERQLRLDPAGIYGKMDFNTRDHYRHVVENLAKRSSLTESDLAQRAIALAQEHRTDSDARLGHVGYYLIDRGLAQLQQSCQSKSHLPIVWLPMKKHIPQLLYFAGITAITLSITLSLLAYLHPVFERWYALFGLGLLLLLSSSQVALALVNWLATLLIKPNLLPRLNFSKGIPDEFRTLVVIPTMLVNHKNIESLLEALEVRYLANRDENLHFALLTDFIDAPSQVLPDDELLLHAAQAGILALNNKYSMHAEDIFCLFHRQRTWNPQENVWMGYERKRGKLEALNTYLRQTSGDPIFARIVGTLPHIKYIITLDTDTQLPRDAARLMVGTMAHPLNQPAFDKKLGRVTHGYGILQPRVATSLPSSQRSLFVRLYGGDAGIDPYTSVVSDVYQDLFYEGSFVGKGIYDIDAVDHALGGVLPENLILSHDLLEGCYARSGLISDVLLFEDFPSHHGDDVKRRSRWIRGDWQIIAWLWPFIPTAQGRSRKNSLSWFSKWKIFDNLRRSLVPLASFLLLTISWIASEDLPSYWFLTNAVLAMIFLPPLLTTLAAATRKPPEIAMTPYLYAVGASLLRHFLQALLAVVFLPFEAFISVTAILRSCWRMALTRHHLLEWKSASDPSHSAGAGIGQFYRNMLIGPLIAMLLFIDLYVFRPQDLALASPFLFLWLLSPALAFWLSRLTPTHDIILSKSQTEFLHRLTRKTWRFFETFVGPEDNWLPPDNFQEYPVAVVAHRTSPTNMGLSLLANLAAYDFGYITASTLMKRTSLTFQTMDGMERFRGHFYNWYDTQSLKPLPPLYVSMVDSGNLAGLLLTLNQGLKEIPDQKIIPPQLIQGLRDTLLALQETTKASLENLFACLELLPKSLDDWRNLQQRLTQLCAGIDVGDSIEAQGWVKAFEQQYQAGIQNNLDLWTPWTAFSQVLTSLPQGGKADEFRQFMKNLQDVPTFKECGQHALQILDWVEALRSEDDRNIPSLNELEFMAKDLLQRTEHVVLGIEKLMQQGQQMATLEYEFLYDKSQHLLSIGYNVSEHRRDNGFYDLLASEARLGSFVAIAQGCLPQEHWFALGRQLTSWNSRATLLSWSGSMFEYLMPLLVMPTFKDTLLDQTYATAVQRQISYGAEHKVPWGISESGYNITDVHLNYQYRAFGVPGLGFKRGLAADLVIAPYASVMALMVVPDQACGNLLRLHNEGFEGSYGFYEAIDYTPSRLQGGQSHAIVRSFMAHHEGMSFLALAYHLHGGRMQKRFLADPLLKATELLLHERVPKVTRLYPHAPEVSGAQRLTNENETDMRVIDTPNTPRPEVHLLSNGCYSVMVTNAGGGYSRWKDLAVTRWREDPTCDNWGTFCFIRDLKSGEVWSATHQPSLKRSSHYEAIFPQARAEFRRRDHGLEMHTEITVSPEDDIELRRFSITNLSSQTRVIELTSYAEVVLVPSAVDEAHPAFSNLFVQTEILPEKQAIFCTRRPRSAKEKTPTLLHLMTVHGNVMGEASYETDRARFIGRGGSIHDPLVMRPGTEGSPLSGQQGSVLDPIVAIRHCIVIEPEETVRVHIVSGIGETRADALALMDKYHDRHVADRVFELAWTHRQVVLRQLNISEADAQLYGSMTSSILYTNSLRRSSPAILSKNRRGQSGLWGYGISGDLPIVLLRIGNLGKTDIVRQLIQAHGYWHMMGLAIDLVIWNEDDSGYRQDLNERIKELVAASTHIHPIERPGGIFVRRSEQMSEEDRILLQTVARAVLTDSNGTLAEQLSRRRRIPAIIPALVPSREAESAAGHLESEPLLFSNGTGGFSQDGREYIISTSSSQLTPAPWSNVIANQFFGTVISESGSAYTWCENAHEFRLTPWNNDALTDSSGEAFYLRDEESGAFWSPTPLPVRADAPYITRHGFGYSTFELSTHGIHSTLTSFVAIDAPVKMSLFKIRNLSDRPRRISLTGYCEWVLGKQRAKSLMHVVSENDTPSGALFVRNPYHGEFGGRVAFFNVSESKRTMSCDRSEFLGRNGHLSHPAAMDRQGLSGRVGASLDPCSAIQTTFDLQPGEERELVFILGMARDVGDARTLLQRFGQPITSKQALEAVGQHWNRSLGAVQVTTADPALNILANGWLVYQTLACRVWARSGYYQSGGAFGFRDQLQDTMALLHCEPGLLREHILRCAAHQYREGDVQHWWHPPSGLGVRTHFSDDYLWLPLATSRYVLALGDTGILNERVHFIDGRQVKVDEEAYSDLPAHSDESATLYEHCVRALRYGMKYGKHGLPLMGCGDWNDGMNLVGEHGKGESVWLAFFLYDVLNKFSEVAKIHGDMDFAAVCRDQSEKIKINIEAEAWDGEWYRRAYFDDGQALGSNSNVECQIDSIPQSWSVLSGAGDPERSRSAMESADRRLVDRNNGLVKLFDPPFDKSALNPGYIKGYVPGVRENGGQYTHAAIWMAMAFATMGDQKRAWELLAMINPLHHGDTAEKIATYKVEPYVMAADVYAVSPHIGRGGWTWYTGSAGWMYRLILESLLGVRLEVDRLFITPCLPPEWSGFELHYRYRETTFDIRVKASSDPHSRVYIDGLLQEGEGLLLTDDHVAHKVLMEYAVRG